MFLVLNFFFFLVLIFFLFFYCHFDFFYVRTCKNEYAMINRNSHKYSVDSRHTIIDEMI